MSAALIGHSGFVGSSLMRQNRFDALFRSTNIQKSAGQRFGTVVCAGAPAQKWLANRDPEGDRRRIDALMQSLDRIECETFILISTVDVFVNPVGVDEFSPTDETSLAAYGLNRLRLERHVASRFERVLIVRLPGLVGPGLRKNVIHDLQHDKRIDAIDSRGIFQFYPMVNLWFDIERALASALKLVHLTAEPLSVADVAAHGFGRPFENHLDAAPAIYDMRTRHAGLFGGRGDYQYSSRESLMAIRAYAQSEPKTA
jgi:hypothetical protein